MSTRLLSTLDSLPKDSSSPEENSFDARLLPTKEQPHVTLPGIQLPARCAADPSVWPTGQSLLSSWLHASVPPEAPTRPDCLARRRLMRHAHVSVLAFAKIIARERWRLPPPEFSAIYLQPTPPLRRLKHAFDLRRTGYQSGGRSGSCVSQHLCFESSVGEQFSLLGNHVPRWGRQALLLDSDE